MSEPIKTTDDQRGAGSDSPLTESVVSNRLLTVPNVLCMIRLMGSFVLVGVAWQEQNKLFLWLFIFLAMTDWLDGKIAIMFNQRSIYGARLDSWADAALYAGLLVGLWILYGAALRTELLWVAAPVVTYSISTAAGFWKYKRWPSYHTRAAKICWFLIIVGTIGLVTDWSLWPMRFALVMTAITNIEALGITLISPVWRADVASIYHAWKCAHQ